jgi:cysteine-rich repeat protein
MRCSPLVQASLFLSLCGATLGCPPAEGPPPPVCGDGVVEGAEVCDDGDAWGGDGCTPLCTDEAGPLEVEPNDSPEDASANEALGDGVSGALRRGDRDCFALEVPEAGAVAVALTEPGGCGGGAALELIDGDGVKVVSGLPSTDTGCPSIDPDTTNAARYLTGGPHTVCVLPLFEAVVPAYRLEIEVTDSCEGPPPIPPEASQDLDSDGLADVCDADDDGDGVLDEDDVCPRAPDGPEQPFGWDTSSDGFVKLWLVLGGFPAGETPGGCEPSSAPLAGEDDADLAPALGDRAGEVPWFATFSWPTAGPTVNFNAWFGDLPAPREAYVATWVRAPEPREAELAVGSDDGQIVWLNGEVVASKANCSGVAPDQVRAPVTLAAGWNRLVHKVYDGGGGWAVVARFYEADGTTPMTDLDVSALGPTPQESVQADGDGDGIGDLCDPTP